MVQAGNLEALLSELRRVHPSSDYEYSCVCDVIGAVTVRLFKPSTQPQQCKALAPGIALPPGYTLAGRWRLGSILEKENAKVRDWGPQKSAHTFFDII